MLRRRVTSTGSQTRQGEVDTGKTGEDGPHDEVLVEGTVQPPFPLEDWCSSHCGGWPGAGPLQRGSAERLFVEKPQMIV
jgi:hypothetical protein